MIFDKNILYNLKGNVLFDKICSSENFLILYSCTNNHKQIFKNFMRQANNKSIVFYVSHRTNQLNFNFDFRNFSYNIINEDVIHDLKSQLDKCFNEIEKNNSNMLLISDWSNTDLSKCEIFVPFLEKLIIKSKGLNPPGWRRKFGKIQHKTPFMLINAFEITDRGNEFIQLLIRMHQRVYLLHENYNTFLLPNISPSLGTIYPKSHVLPQKALEKLMKDNLELVTLLFLEKENKSGYQILKEIASNFHCILSQGTLYPLLYQLEKENKITKQNGKGREVIYSLTEETKDSLKSIKETCLRSYQHLASFFEN